jgi:hypothetical protein
MFVRKLKNRSGSNLAKQEIKKLSQQPCLFVSEADTNVEKVFAALQNANIRTVGPEITFGRIYDYIGFGAINEPMFRHLVISRIAFPLSKLKTVDYIYRYEGRSLNIDAVYRFLDKLNSKLKPDVEQIAFAHTQKILNGNNSVVFYDMTTLYFESIVLKAEYFIDDDPGFGKAHEIMVSTPGKDVTIETNINLTGLVEGDHILYLRAKDEAGQWGQLYAQGFNLIATGLNQLDFQSRFLVYPNPSDGQFTIQLADVYAGESQLKIFSEKSSLVFEASFNTNQQTFQLPLPAGKYIIQIGNHIGVFTQKIIIF